LLKLTYSIVEFQNCLGRAPGSRPYRGREREGRKERREEEGHEGLAPSPSENLVYAPG